MFLAWRELKHAKFRFFMIGMILVLISWLVFILSGLGNGLSNLSAASFKNLDAAYVIFEDGSRHSMMRSVISEDLVEDLKDEENVVDAAPLGSQTVVVLQEDVGTEEEKIDAALMGINPGTFLEPDVIEGKQLAGNDAHTAIVDASLKSEGMEIGDTIEIDGSGVEIEVSGFVENESLFHVPAIFVDMEVWRDVQFAAPGSDLGVKRPVNAIMIQGETIVPEDLNEAIDGIEVATKDEAVNGVPGYAESTETIKMMLGFLLAISAFVITVFFYVMSLQKSDQFGIMKAIGANNAFLGRAVVSQVTVLAIVSIGFGILLTIGTAAIFPEQMPFELDWVLVGTYALVLLAVSVLSSLISVRKITKIDPLQAIGRVE